MGDNFLKKQIRNFERSTDLATEFLNQQPLIQRNDAFKTSYRAKPLDGEFFQGGETLFAVVSKNGMEIALARGHRHIGNTTGQGAQALKEAMCDIGSILKVKVVNVAGVSGRATIEVLEE